ncbi:MAG: helix-turn-helix transcriptional regulator [Saprospirales bacterium]|nr:helix-turn-helix transcriptional regulator [Saprospirales bacterium]MBK8493376.1 helix-turn-helix transcriptional regulator [Saprospirales bacterium]
MKTTFTLQFLEESTETMRAIAHPIRIAIIDLLHRNGKMSVTEIYESLDIEQAVASHHLRILKSRNVVSMQRDQKFSLYSLANPGYFDIVQILGNLT